MLAEHLLLVDHIDEPFSNGLKGVVKFWYWYRTTYKCHILIKVEKESCLE